MVFYSKKRKERQSDPKRERKKQKILVEKRVHFVCYLAEKLRDLGDTALLLSSKTRARAKKEKKSED